MTVDDQGKKSFCKTTTLESLAILTTLCLDPLRFIEQEALFHIDNMATVLALEKGHSRDLWASTIVRAARVVAASLGCEIFATWERRRSSRGSIIADELTHNLVACLNDEELSAYILRNTLSFPAPILQWMMKPGRDLTLGRRCVLWVRESFPAVRFLRPQFVR